MLSRTKTTAAVVLAAALALTGCAASERDTATTAPTDGATPGAPAGADTTFIFGAAGAPKLFDPFYASDGETFRVTR
ncbi:MAG: hypothetical protein Q4F65_14215, partial [Propionibacteriaceae bacterium]|nr:hypothetical protein [Propionibacteriaceae bacterium]